MSIALPPRLSTSPNLIRCQGPNVVKGIDVSHDQKSIVWPSVKSSGIDFCFIKATEGINEVDPMFKSNWVNSKIAGFLRGAYHFFHANVDGADQANHFLNTVGQLGLDDLPLVLDWEVTDNVSIQQQIAQASIFLSILKLSSQKIPIIYTGWGFYNALKNPSQFFPYTLWQAEYGVTCPKVPPPWNNWTFWQNAEGSVTGVPTKCDMDLFNGSISDLTSFISSNNI